MWRPRNVFCCEGWQGNSCRVLPWACWGGQETCPQGKVACIWGTNKLECKEITRLSPQVKQGWGPLCEFLDVPIPDCPFPRVNDTEEMKRTGRYNPAVHNLAWSDSKIVHSVFSIMQVLSTFLIIIVPLALSLGCTFLDWDIPQVIGGYLVFLLFCRIFVKNLLLYVLTCNLQKQKTE